MDSLDIPDGMSVILRTSSLESSEESIKWDIEYLIQIYESVLETSVQQDAPFLIYPREQHDGKIDQRLL